MVSKIVAGGAAHSQRCPSWMPMAPRAPVFTTSVAPRRSMRRPAARWRPGDRSESARLRTSRSLSST